jgi:uncharacterized membrane protein YqjE
MYHEQELGIYMLFTSIGFIFVGTAVQMWANYPPYFAFTLTVLYSIGFLIFAWTGYHTFKVFQLDYRVSREHLEKDRGNLNILLFLVATFLFF